MMLRPWPGAHGWMQLLREKEARVVTPGSGPPILRTTVDLFGNIALQVHGARWNGIGPDARVALTAEHRARLDAAMAPLVAPERALAGAAFATRLGIVALTSGGAALGTAELVDLAWSLASAPLAAVLLWRPARLGSVWLTRRALLRFWESAR